MNKRQDEIARMVLNYLKKNPDAGDTLEGITRWWLEKERIELLMHEVAGALERLIRKGMISEHKAKGGITFYKIYRKT